MTTNKFEEKAHEIVNAGYCGTCKTICGGHVICDTEELPCDDPYWMPLRDNDDLFISAISSALEAAYQEGRQSEAAMNELVKIGQEVDKDPTNV